MHSVRRRSTRWGRSECRGRHTRAPRRGCSFNRRPDRPAGLNARPARSGVVSVPADHHGAVAFGAAAGASMLVLEIAHRMASVPLQRISRPACTAGRILPSAFRFKRLFGFTLSRSAICAVVSNSPRAPGVSRSSSSEAVSIVARNSGHAVSSPWSMRASKSSRRPTTRRLRRASVAPRRVTCCFAPAGARRAPAQACVRPAPGTAAPR